ncbi:MAG: hypothetical protein ACD_12C00869G0003 [uncultured bacterium]|nr:MAG: hypothetical protein ACD_12C00869G0003 [uncultured bacterium]
MNDKLVFENNKGKNVFFASLFILYLLIFGYIWIFLPPRSGYKTLLTYYSAIFFPVALLYAYRYFRSNYQTGRSYKLFNDKIKVLRGDDWLEIPYFQIYEVEYYGKKGDYQDLISNLYNWFVIKIKNKEREFLIEIPPRIKNRTALVEEILKKSNLYPTKSKNFRAFVWNREGDISKGQEVSTFVVSRTAIILIIIAIILFIAIMVYDKYVNTIPLYN